MDVARELNISPWEALLKSVRASAGRSEWIDAQLKAAVMRNDGESHAAEVMMWMKESRDERTLLARFAKAAIDAGVAERLVRNVELEGKVVAEVIGRTLDQLALRMNMTPELRIEAFEIAHTQMLVLESPSGTAVEVQGTWQMPGVVDPGVAGGGAPGRSEGEDVKGKEQGEEHGEGGEGDVAG